MKRIAALAAITLFLALGATFLARRHDRPGPAIPQPQASGEHQGAPGLAPGAATVPKFTHDGTAAAPKVRDGLPRLARERREGESDLMFRERLRYNERYGTFVHDAKLTEDQEKKLRILLADFQVNAAISLRSGQEEWFTNVRPKNAQKASREALMDLVKKKREGERILQNDLDKRLGDVLTPAQRRLLMDYRDRYGIDLIPALGFEPFGPQQP